MLMVGVAERLPLKPDPCQLPVVSNHFCKVNRSCSHSDEVFRV